MLPMVAAVASGEQVNLAGVGFPRCQETKQILDRPNRAGLEFALGVVFASVNCRWDFPLGSVYIDYFQRTTFCHAASGVETHSSSRAIAMSLQPLVKKYPSSVTKRQKKIKIHSHTSSQRRDLGKSSLTPLIELSL